jgi:UDP:flavonoid glycosyltransferase YjiC (YdhE family)
MYKLAVPFNDFAKKHQVELYGNYKDVLTKGTYTLYCDYKGLLEIKNLTSSKKIIGPFIYENVKELPDELKTRTNKKRIFIGLGSSGPGILLDDMLEMLNSIDAEVIVCANPKSLKVKTGSHIKFYDFLPYSQISKHVDLVICNGGSSSVYASLMNGVPALMLPINFDQVIFSSLIEQMNAGSVLRFDEFEKLKFKYTVNSMLFDEIKSQVAKKIQKEFEAIDPAQNILNEINSIYKKEKSA